MVDVVDPRSEDANLIIPVITFEITQHIYAHGPSTSQTDRRTDGRTDDLR